MNRTISFIGDVMLGRMIGTKYGISPYKTVSDGLIQKARMAKYVMANLESPVVNKAKTDGDHLQFKGNPDVLEELNWIDAFSLANNHINDCDILGMDETIDFLEQKGFLHNGLFKGSYTPLIFEEEQIAVVTITDMMNIPFKEGCKWDVLRVGEDRIMEIIKEYHDKGYFVILYAHIGILFSRFPNPKTYNYLHECVDNGADVVVTAHSHCLGCMEIYQGKYIFHSLGDFVMDGNSYRRRRSGILQLSIENHQVTSWNIIPAEINLEYQTVEPSIKVSQKMIQSFENVSSSLLLHSMNYEHYFKWRYKKEMMLHASSTLYFLMKTRGFRGMMRMVIQRSQEVARMFKWIVKDRSKDQRDDEAIRADRKKFTESELFNKK